MFSRFFNAARKKLPAITNQIRNESTVNWHKYHFIKPEDISVVQSTWKKMNTDTNKTCRLIFKIMFTKMPDTEKLFERYKDSPTTPVVDSKQFEPRCTSFVVNMTEIITNLNDEEATLRILKKMADGHKGVVPSEYFITLIDVMIEALRKLGGNEFTAPVEKKWRKILFATMTTVNDFLE